MTFYKKKEKKKMLNLHKEEMRVNESNINIIDFYFIKKMFLEQ